ncbi:hypothetical protein SAMN05444401_1701 [Clostridium amylolyticum]|uniref:Uncharacterized protein n=1 Tax=Clostridium amylolyticum TaxID=1121298 RepID=A0A1M6EUN1_9CLOT|nr:hypothetical protein [Clostridium amylolyticum]SHI89184.1 hypothetical protein SAMN05444401_1701 [Clostridium amylolyticum]
MEEIIDLKDQVILKDLGGQEYVVVRMYCTINIGKSYNMIIDIQDKEKFENNKAVCLEKIRSFKATAEQRAYDNGIEII